MNTNHPDKPPSKKQGNRRRKEKYVTQQPTPQNSVTGLDSEAEHSKLQRGLSYRHIQLIAIGGAIGTGLFLGSAKTIALTGPSIIFVYAIIGSVIYFVLRAMGEILLSNPKYKSFTDFITDILGLRAGFFVGWSYWFFWVVTGIADVIAITGYVQYWLPGMPKFIPALVVITALLLLNLPSVKNFGEIEFWFAVIKIVAIVALIIVGALMVAFSFTSPDGTTASLAHLWDHPGPSGSGIFTQGVTGFLGSFQIALFAFVGAELVGTAVAETKHPERTLPKAINAVPFRIALFYAVPLLTILAVTPWDKLDKSMSPFVGMFSLAGIGIAASLVNFVVLTSAASSANSGIFSTSRMVYGLAHDGAAPSALGKLTKNGVPANALYLTTVLLLFSLVMLYAGNGIMEAFTVVTSVASMMGIFTWSMILIAYLVYRKKFPERHEASQYKMPWGIGMSWFGLIFFAVMVYALSLYPDTAIGLALTPVWFIALAIGYKILTRRHAAKRARALVGEGASQK